MCGYVRVCVRDEQRHQTLEPPRTPPTTKKRRISLCGPCIMRKPRRGRGVRLYLLSLSLTVNDCVCDMYTRRPKRKSRAHINSSGTCVGRHAADASETDSGGLAIHSRVQSLGDSVSGGAGDSSGFRGSALTAPPGGGGGRCRPHSMSDARF